MGSDRLSREELELVLRRATEMDAAAELDGTSATGNADALSVQEVVRLGREAGLRPDTIMRALAEMRRGALAPPEPAGAIDRLWGPSHVVVTRSVPGAPEVVQRAVDRFLRQQLMTVRRHHGERIEWEKARGLFPGLARSIDFAKRYAFGPVTSVETLVTRETATTSSVTFKIDLSGLRAGRLTSLAVRGSVAFGVLGVGGALLFPGFGIADLAALACGGAAAGGLSALERRRFEKTRDRIALEPERFLDILVQRQARREAGQESSPPAGDDEDET